MRYITIFLGVLILTSLASAEIILTQQPVEVYNLGEIITIPVTVKTLSDQSGSFRMDLICDGQETNFFKNGILLKSGEEKKQEASIILSKEVIGELKGNCLIKASFGEDYTVTNSFKISNLIKINQETSNKNILPEDIVVLRGTATRESGENANGFVKLEVFSQSSTPYKTIMQTVRNGIFILNFTAPKDMPAGEYSFLTTAYEKENSEETTNLGTYEEKITVKQLPTNLELISEKSVQPGKEIIIEPILHDQTGLNINANITFIIKNSKDKLIEKFDKTTQEKISYPIPQGHPPEEIKIYAESMGIKNQFTVNVLEKKDISMTIKNQTLIIQNTGNLPYCNKNLLVKIGAVSKGLDVCLKVGESKAYILNAPNGEYDIQILSEENSINEKAVLTGNAIGIKEATQALTITRYPFVWIFVIAIFGFITFIFYKKGFKRSFIGRVTSKPQVKQALPPHFKTVESTPKTVVIGKKNVIKSKSRALLSLSIKGEKQDATVMCLRIKNLAEIESSNNNAGETLQKVVDIAESSKAATYDNQGSLFFIWTPLKTKTFRNEEVAIKTAERAIDILSNHNKLFKQKVEYGISLNKGFIVAKQEADALQFMSMGNLMINAKKISTLSNGEILLSPEIKEKLPANFKAEKQSDSGTQFYILKEVKDISTQQKFISRFLERQDK